MKKDKDIPNQTDNEITIKEDKDVNSIDKLRDLKTPDKINLNDIKVKIEKEETNSQFNNTKKTSKTNLTTTTGINTNADTNNIKVKSNKFNRKTPTYNLSFKLDDNGIVQRLISNKDIVNSIRKSKGKSDKATSSKH